MVSNEFQVSNAFRLQMQGFGLTTAEIHYRLPDYRDLLQLFIWQEYDIAPDFPTLKHSSNIGNVRSKARCIPCALLITV